MLTWGDSPIPQMGPERVTAHAASKVGPFLSDFTLGAGSKGEANVWRKLGSMEERTSVPPFERVGAVNGARGGEGRTRLLESEEHVTA